MVDVVDVDVEVEGGVDVDVLGILVRASEFKSLVCKNNGKKVAEEV